MASLFRPFLVLAALVALVLTGCSSVPAHNDADVAFATGMVPHHQQAVQMSDVLLTKTGVDGDVLALATTIKAEQAPEIAQLTGWLSAWGAPAPSGSGDMGGMAGSGGMMSQGDMDALTHAQGRDAQTLFLRGMITHHQGAVAMAQTEVAQGRNDDAKALAAKIITSQQAEIDQMNGLLAG